MLKQKLMGNNTPPPKQERPSADVFFSKTIRHVHKDHWQPTCLASKMGELTAPPMQYHKVSHKLRN